MFLHATVKHHLQGFPDSEVVVTELNEDMCVVDDEWLLQCRGSLC